MTGSKKIKKIEELLKELPSPLDDWALSQVDKSCEGWRDKCENLIWAVGSFAQWHKTKEGVDFWYDVLERAGNNTIHEHPDVVAWNERPKLNPEYHDEGKRKTITNQEKDLQMEGKSENQHGDITRKFLAERGLKEKDWYGTAQNGDIQEVDLRELLQDYASHVKAFQNKKLLKALTERGELETQIEDYKKTFLRVRNFLANTKVNDAAGEDEQQSLFYILNKYLRP